MNSVQDSSTNRSIGQARVEDLANSGHVETRRGEASCTVPCLWLLSLPLVPLMKTSRIGLTGLTEGLNSFMYI